MSGLDLEIFWTRIRPWPLASPASVRVGAQEGERRPRLNYGRLVHRSEREIAAALGLGETDEVVEIMRRMVPDTCKPLKLATLPEFLDNPVTRKALLNTDVIAYPALLLLRNPYLCPHLTGSFLTEISRIFPHSLDILTCPWGPLLRGGGKGDSFTWKYQQASDVVQFDPDAVIESVEDLERKYYAISARSYSSLPEYGEMR